MTHPALIERITRSLAYMLRHQPDRFGLQLDSHGFGAVPDVVRALNERLGEPVDERDLEEAIVSGDRPRYELRDGRVRALYGHSIEIEPGEPTQPSEFLYVGIDARDADRAARYGLRGGRRRFLHLALNVDDAREAGRRAGRDYAVLRIFALDAWEEGNNFYDRKTLFLCEHVPTQFLEVLETNHDGYEPREEDQGQGGHAHGGGHGGGGHGGGHHGGGRRDGRREGRHGGGGGGDRRGWSHGGRGGSDQGAPNHGGGQHGRREPVRAEHGRPDAGQARPDTRRQDFGQRERPAEFEPGNRAEFEPPQFGAEAPVPAASREGQQREHVRAPEYDRGPARGPSERHADRPQPERSFAERPSGERPPSAAPHGERGGDARGERHGDRHGVRRDRGERHHGRRDEVRRDEPRRDEPRRDEPRRDEPRRDEPRRDDFRGRDSGGRDAGGSAPQRSRDEVPRPTRAPAGQHQAGDFGSGVYEGQRGDAPPPRRAPQAPPPPPARPAPAPEPSGGGDDFGAGL